MQAVGPGPLHDAPDEGLAPLVAGLVQGHAEKLAQDPGAGRLLQAPPPEGLRERTVGADQTSAHRVHDVVHVAGHRGEQRSQRNLQPPLFVLALDAYDEVNIEAATVGFTPLAP